MLGVCCSCYVLLVLRLCSGRDVSMGQGMVRLCSGYVLVMFWLCSGSVQIGPALTFSLLGLGHVIGMFWLCSAYVMVIIWS